VLAHTLGALSIQLTAIDTLARNNAPREKLITQIELGHELVSTGLDEARQAVRALRGENAPPAAQLERLCELHQAELELDGGWQELEADTTLTLYRLVQEALTNAVSHAPGTRVSVRVGFGPRDVTVQVGNTGPAPGPDTLPAPRASGGGFGLRGMRERVEQVCGDLQAGPTSDGGWQVTARIPYRQANPGNRSDGSDR